MVNNSRKLNAFDWFLILGTTIVSIASSLLGEGWDTLGFIVAVSVPADGRMVTTDHHQPQSHYQEILCFHLMRV